MRSVHLAAVSSLVLAPAACGGLVEEAMRSLPDASAPEPMDAGVDGDIVSADAGDGGACSGAPGTITRIGHGYRASHMVAGTGGRIYAQSDTECMSMRAQRTLWRFLSDGGPVLSTCGSGGYLGAALAFDAVRQRLMRASDTGFFAWFEEEAMKSDGSLWLRPDTSVSDTARGGPTFAADATGLRFIGDGLAPPTSTRTDPSARGAQTFDGGLGIRSSRVDIEVFPDTSALVAGHSPDELPAIVRLLPESPAVDSAFGDGGVVTIGTKVGVARQVARDSQSRLLVDVAVGPSNCAACDVQVARLTASGSLDPTYGTNGFATLPMYRHAHLERTQFVIDGERAVVAGMSPLDARVVRVVRLTATGALDPSFGGAGFIDLPPTMNSEGIQYALLVRETSCGAYVVLVGDSGLFRITP